MKYNFSLQGKTQNLYSVYDQNLLDTNLAYWNETMTVNGTE